VIKKPRKRGGYNPARGLQNINPQWVVTTGENKSWCGSDGCGIGRDDGGGGDYDDDDNTNSNDILLQLM